MRMVNWRTGEWWMANGEMLEMRNASAMNPRMTVKQICKICKCNQYGVHIYCGKCYTILFSLSWLINCAVVILCEAISHTRKCTNFQLNDAFIFQHTDTSTGGRMAVSRCTRGSRVGCNACDAIPWKTWRHGDGFCSKWCWMDFSYAEYIEVAFGILKFEWMLENERKISL